MRIVSTDPAQNATNVSQLTSIAVVFDLDIKPDSVDKSSLVVSFADTKILVPNQIQPSLDKYKTDTIFKQSGMNSFVDGDVYIDSTDHKKLIFKPKFKLEPNTNYTVYVSQSIAGSDSSLLGGIKKFTFKTTEEDIAEPIPDIPQSNIIIGNNVITNSNPISTMRIANTLPRENAVMVDSQILIFTFTENINASKFDSNNNISIYVEEILSDYPAYKADATIYSATVSGKVLTITFNSSLAEECQYTVVLTNIESESGAKLSSYEFNFLTQMIPYYTSIASIRLLAGSILGKISDFEIAKLIYWVSQEADIKLKKLRILPEPDFSHIRAKWVMYSVLEKILSRDFDDPAYSNIRKQLGDFVIQIDSSNRVKLFNNLMQEIRDFKRAFADMLNFRLSSGIVGLRAANSSDEFIRLWGRGIQPGLNGIDTRNRKLIWDEIGTPLTFNGENKYEQIQS